MAKQLAFGSDARQKLYKGIDILAKAVVTTLGPRGRNVALDKQWGAPNVVHDGVTVAKEIDLEDPYENMGAQLIKEAASKTNDDSGDGTTTSTLLARAIVQEGLKNIAAGNNPMMIKKGIEKGVQTIVEKMGKLAKPVKGKTEIAQVATISAADETIGSLIADALDKVGKNGVVTVEDGKGLDVSIDYKEGMEFDKGYASPYFVTNPDSMEAEIDNPYLLITDQKITAISDILPLLESLVKVTKNLVIIAEDIEGEALATLVVNKLRGSFNVLAIKAPGFGDRRKAMLEDIAIVTGGTVISEDTGRKLDSATMEDLGQADKVWADKEACQIIGGKGKASAIKDRVELLQQEINNSDSEFDQEKLQERLAKLSGGVAIINVGAATEVELNEKKERVKDAVEATKAAVEEGVVPGGGITLLKLRKHLDKVKAETTEEQIGLNILKEAMSKPLYWIAANSGANPGWVVKKVESSSKATYGYNALTGKFGDLLADGIVDPAKVTRTALQNAASVAIMVLTTEVLVTDLPEEEEKPSGGPSLPGGAAGMPEM